jgi:Flp pilus assembly protein TadD
MRYTLRDGLICLALTVITLAVYWHLTSAGFVIYDDANYVSDNPHVQSGLNWTGLVWAFTTGRAGNWHPLTWISHMIDCGLFGLQAGRHHLVNILFHTANTLLLFSLFRQMTGAVWRSAVVAALFAWHPLHVESVAWIAERKDVLSTFFWTLALLAYAAYVRRPAKARYALLLALFALALLAKPMVVTLPFLLLLLDFWPLKRASLEKNTAKAKASRDSWPRLLLEKLPLIALSGASCIITYHAQAAEGATDKLGAISLALRLGNALVAYACYLGKIFWPAHLAVFYPYNQTLPAWQVTGAALVIGGITSAAFLALRTRPYFLAGWFWFLGTLVPAIGFVQVGLQAMADRYTYVPATGIFIILVWGAAELAVMRPKAKIPLGALALMALTGCIAKTVMQEDYWQSPERLFRHSLEVTTDNPVMEYNLGFALQEQGKEKEAIVAYENSLGLNPNQNPAHNNLGMCLAKIGKDTEACAHYREALRLNPSIWATHLDYGLALRAMGDTAGALAEFSESIRLEPENSQPHFSLGVLLLSLGRLTEAEQELAKATQLNPSDAAAHTQLASALDSLGKTRAAVGEYRSALRLAPDSTVALNDLAWTLASNPDASIRNGADAVRLAAHACELTHYQTPILIGTLAAAYAEAGNFKEAVAFAAKARDLALANGQNEVAARNEELLQLYRAGKAFHAPP